jgi:hypothetical protein
MWSSADNHGVRFPLVAVPTVSLKLLDVMVVLGCNTIHRVYGKDKDCWWDKVGVKSQARWNWRGGALLHLKGRILLVLTGFLPCRGWKLGVVQRCWCRSQGPRKRESEWDNAHKVSQKHFNGIENGTGCLLMREGSSSVSQFFKLWVANPRE